MSFTRSYQRAVQFNPEQFNPITLAESAQTRVILACFEPDQFIPVHSPPIDLTLVVLEGEGTLVAGDSRRAIAPGTVAFVPAGEARGIEASSQLVALFTVTPPPTAADHKDVVAGLQQKRQQEQTS